MHAYWEVIIVVKIIVLLISFLVWQAWWACVQLYVIMREYWINIYSKVSSNWRYFNRKPQFLITWIHVNETIYSSVCMCVLKSLLLKFSFKFSKHYVLKIDIITYLCLRVGQCIFLYNNTCSSIINNI